MDGFLRTEKVIEWQRRGETLRVEAWGANSLRVRATKNPTLRDEPGALLDAPAAAGATVTRTATGATIRNGKLAAEVDENGLISFRRDTGEELVAETWSHPSHGSLFAPARLYKAAGGELFRTEARFQAYDDERLYGLGQHRHGLLDQKGCVIELMQRNCEVNIPFLVSSRGYGFLWNNPAVGQVELGRNRTRWIAEATPQLDYWITAGDYAGILRQYADATGHAPMLPAWAAGFWQSKLRYLTQEELLGVAREYKRRGLPLSVIVVDFFHWTALGEYEWDAERWPDPAGMARELKEMGVEVMASVWPAINPNCKFGAEYQRRGLVVRAERGLPFFFPFIDTKAPGLVYVMYYDPSNPEARAYVWDKVKRNYYDRGIKIYWLDDSEPDLDPFDHDNLRFHAGNGAAVANLYPLWNAQTFYDGLRAAGETEILMFSRSGWAGIQRYGVVIWSGDIPSTFASLREQVRAGLNMALSGIPWWTTDIGGFMNGDPGSPEFQELIVRWFQYGVFCPLFRLHGVRLPMHEKEITGAANEVWSFGDRAYELIRDLMALRERLRPYVMAQMRVAHETGLPPMRPLFVDFPADADCLAVEDEFLFGPDILVAPVTAAGVTSRDVYLPAGADWTNAWTGERHSGGQTLTVAAPLERIPVFLKNDANLP